MSTANDSANEVIRKWSKEIPSTNINFWNITRTHVHSLRELHSTDSPLNLITRMRAATQCLKSIQYAVCYLERISQPTESKKSSIAVIAEVLEDVVLLLSVLLKPCNAGLASQLCDFPVVRRIVFLSTVECDNLKKVAIEALRNFIDDRPELVNAVISMSRNQLGNDVPANASPPAPKKDGMLDFLSMATVGSRLPAALCQRSQLVPTGAANSLTAPAQLHQVLTADVLPVLVALLNAPWRDKHHGWLLVGACPETRRLRGILMNYDDQDGFRLGFDQQVLERLHPQPTADIIRLRILPLSTADQPQNGSPSKGLRELCEMKQRERVPCLIVIEVGQILIEEGFSYADRDNVTKLRRYVTITMQNTGVKLVPKGEETRKTSPPLSVKERLTNQIAQLDRQLADAKRKKNSF